MSGGRGWVRATQGQGGLGAVKMWSSAWPTGASWRQTQCVPGWGEYGQACGQVVKDEHSGHPGPRAAQ